jgi:alkylated DNA repair protein alkB family protein 8
VVDQITANVYATGDGIAPHVDNPYAFGASIVSLSLLSPTHMQFVRGPNVFVTDLPRQSLLVLTSEARYTWTHSITPRKHDVIAGDVRGRRERISLTFRKCVDQQAAGDIIERALVKQTYDHIAQNFSDSRYKMWPMVAEFVAAIPPTHLVADLGCGNGKNIVERGVSGLGLDVSINLAKICRERGLEVVCGDCLNVQFRSCLFDVVISIAVLHHMTTERRRIKALREIGRILRPGGRAMVTSWAMEQSLDGQSSNYVQQGGPVAALKSNNSPHSQHLPIHKPRTQFESQDVLVPFKGVEEGRSDDSKAVHRFYHVFRKGEMADLARKAEIFSEIEERYDDGNYVLFISRR